MRYKFKFVQFVSGIENCEAVIEADSQDEAMDKFDNREFTIYLVVKQVCERYTHPDYPVEVSIVKES